MSGECRWSRLGTRQWVDKYLDVLLQVLRPFERLAAEFALVRLEGNVNTDV